MNEEELKEAHKKRQKKYIENKNTAMAKYYAARDGTRGMALSMLDKGEGEVDKEAKILKLEAENADLRRKLEGKGGPSKTDEDYRKYRYNEMYEVIKETCDRGKKYLELDTLSQPTKDKDVHKAW